MSEMTLMPHDYVLCDDGVVAPKGSGFGGKHTSLPAGYRKKLSAPLPKGAIKDHPSKKGMSTIKAIFIVERLNDVFGIGGWNLEHQIIETMPDRKLPINAWVNGKNGAKGGYKPTGEFKDEPYILMKGRIYIRKYDLYTPYQYGGHHTEGKGTEPADGYKSAVTDIQSKCGSLLEIGIQVFKGNPDSQEGNESQLQPTAPKETKTPDEKEGEKLMEKKINTPVEKAPEAEKPAPAKKTAAKKAPAKKPAAKKVEAPPVEAPPVEEAEVISETPAESPTKQALIDCYAEVKSYVSSSDLKDNAQAIVFNATIEECTKEEIEELKQAIRDHHKELKAGGN